MAENDKVGGTESMSLMDQMRDENIRNRATIERLNQELEASDQVRYLALDELAHVRGRPPNDERVEPLIEALMEACTFAVDQGNNTPAGAGLRCIYRWRETINRARGRHILHGTAAGADDMRLAVAKLSEDRAAGDGPSTRKEL